MCRVRTDGRWVPTRGTPTVVGVPRAQGGSPEGHRPNGRSLRVSLRTYHYFPLPLRKEAGGMVRRGRRPSA